MNKILLILLLIALPAFAQWTVPDTTLCPQPGPGAESPWISNDNLRLYMSNMAEVYVFSRRSPDSPWGPRTFVPRINLTSTQRCPAESPSGDTLYFIGDARTDCENYGSWDIYYTIRTGPCDTCWGPVHNAGANVSSNHREYSVGISRDGSTLLVSSQRGQFVAPKLYWHEKQPDGTWAPANYFPAEINDLNVGEEHPCLSPDNNRLFFCHTDEMLGDIWVSRKVNGVWQQAGPLPSPPNNWPVVTLDEDPCLAADGRTLWYRHTFNDSYMYKISVSVDTSTASANPRNVVSKPGFVVWPNPTNGAVQLNGPLEQVKSIVVYNVLGQKVQELVLPMQRVTSLSLPGVLELSSGTYYLSIQTRHDNLVRKLVIQK